ncbi:DUF3397 family protein [Streptococcus sp. DD13]|uniref:DUF3397 family protein n=1 Tax=Streptococcus sp. DD13 TaxID=1777881 RepID=UPI0018D46B3F
MVSDRAYTHSGWPILGLAFSVLGLALLIRYSRSKKEFTYRRFLKLFWRAGFLLMVLLYIFLLIALYL